MKDRERIIVLPLCCKSIHKRECIKKGFDNMRIALNEIDHSEDMSMNYFNHGCS